MCGLSLGLIHDVAHYRLPVRMRKCSWPVLFEGRNARGIGSGAGVANGEPSISAAGSYCRSGSGG
jgi:hypothetical protein